MQVYLRKNQFKASGDMDAWVQQLATRTEGYTSADLKGLVQNAQLAKMSEALKIGTEDFHISEDDVEAALATFSRGMGISEAKRYQAVYEKWMDRSGPEKVGSQ